MASIGIPPWRLYTPLQEALPEDYGCISDTILTFTASCRKIHIRPCSLYRVPCSMYHPSSDFNSSKRGEELKYMDYSTAFDLLAFKTYLEGIQLL